MPKSAPAYQRFWLHVDRRSDDECWLWKGGKSPKGYGSFWISRRQCIGAHVFSWAMANGNSRPPKRTVVMHSCDQPMCVNPKHLSIGTFAQNQADMAKKFRSRTKLSAEQVREIRGSDEPYRVLAARYGLKSHKSISNIKARHIFGHVDDGPCLPSM